MKNFKVFFVILACMTAIIGGILSCQKTGMETKSTKEVFEAMGKVYDSEEADNLIIKGKLANAPENALVALLFKENGELYSKEEMEILAPKWHTSQIEIPSLYTDLKTFFLVTKQVTAIPSYALIIPDQEGRSVFVYDAYRMNYKTRDELENEVEGKITTGSLSSVSTINWTNYLKEADVLKGKWSPSSPCNGISYGHACIVYKKASNATYITPNSMLAATKTFDAWAAVSNYADQVGEKNGNVYWANNCTAQRARLRYSPALTSTNIHYIKGYSKNQDPDGYSWSSSLGDTTKWYCSKLVYRAYLHAGKNVGNGAIAFVTPNDIAADSDMIGESF